ncbi:MAG: biotin--[acetyl-CoA-carboxylase] ligase [Planctomycetota bacterium]
MQTRDTQPSPGESDLSTWADAVEAACPGWRCAVYRSTASTQALAKQAVAAGPAESSRVWVADEQTAGRGRRDRVWASPAGAGVWASLAPKVDPSAEVSPVAWCLVGALAAARAVDRALGGARTRLKWPNDVYVDGCKIAGVLAETVATAQVSAAVLGVGINTRLPEVGVAPPGARPVDVHGLGGDADRLALLIELVRQVQRAAGLAGSDPGALADEWRARTAMLGRTFRFAWPVGDGYDGVSGEVIDLDPSAGLVVRTDRSIVAVPPSASVLDYDAAFGADR